MKVFYWSPHINHIATIKAVLNSAASLSEFGHNKYDARIINTNGEWNNFKSEKVKFINLSNSIYFNTFPINGFFASASALRPTKVRVLSLFKTPEAKVVEDFPK